MKLVSCIFHLISCWSTHRKNVRSSRSWKRRCCFSGLWIRVDSYVDTSVSKEHKNPSLGLKVAAFPTKLKTWKNVQLSFVLQQLRSNVSCDSLSAFRIKTLPFSIKPLYLVLWNLFNATSFLCNLSPAIGQYAESVLVTWHLDVVYLYP